METIKYGDIQIGSMDEEYIDILEKDINNFLKQFTFKDLTIDAYEAPLYLYNSCLCIYGKPIIANDIIYYIISEAILKLPIEEESKDLLIENIYCNCMDSSIDIEPKKENFSWESEENLKIIKEFCELI